MKQTRPGESLEAAIRAIVDARLRELGVTRAEVEYRADGPLPPGIRSREHFAAECRRLRIGRKDGRVWVVGASEWHEARASRRSGTKADEPNTDEAIDAQLRGAGLRLV